MCELQGRHIENPNTHWCVQIFNHFKDSGFKAETVPITNADFEAIEKECKELLTKFDRWRKEYVSPTRGVLQ